jgi:2-desacetyl-2-hydroxyethyl bacteriochlorophyllide A dehydrogenase
VTSGTSKAVVLHGPGEASLEEVPILEPGPGDALIRVAYEGVCGTDLEMLHGTLGYFRQGLSSYPIVPGHEFSGEVIVVGGDVQGIRAGARVVCEPIQSCGRCEACLAGNWVSCPDRVELGVIRRDGAYAEHVCVPARFLHELPKDVGLETGALSEPLAVVMKGLGRLQRTWAPGSSKRCAVVGAGPIGHLAAQVLAHRGHRVVAIDTDPARRGYVDDVGIETSGEMSALADSEAIVEATGSVAALGATLGGAAPGASVLLLGLPYGELAFDFEGLVAYDRTIVGSVGSGPEDFREAIRTLPSLDMGPFTTGTFPLAGFLEAWQSFERRDHLKIMLKAGGA